MKGIVTLLATIVLFCVSCSSHTKIDSFKKHDKTITIAIRDDGDGIAIDNALPLHAEIRKGGKVHWSIVNNCDEKTLDSVFIYEFVDEGGSTDKLFKGDENDQKFEFKNISLLPGDVYPRKPSKETVKSPEKPSVTYKYKIKAQAEGAVKEVDPWVIVKE